jgi:iron complex outermembrane receptor protein
MRTTTLFASISALALMTSGAAYAQTAAPSGTPVDDTTVAEVIVTGSRIARRDYVSASPIVTLGQDALTRSASVNVEAALNQLPQFAQGQNQSAIGAVNGGGRATLNLRGLGETRNLILLDGRRLPLSSAFGVVDVNIIPPSIIADIETISGGASAVYGSDAISGVVNFKTKRHFDGLEFTARHGQSFKNDADTNDFSVTGGVSSSDDRAHALLSVGYSDRKVLWGSDRPDFFALGVLSSFIGQGTFVPSATNLPSQAAINGVFAGYGVTAGAVPNSRNLGFNDDGTLFSQIGTQNYKGPTTNLWSTTGGSVRQPVTMQEYIVQPMDRTQLFGKFDYKLNDHITAYAQFLQVRSKVTGQVGWSPTLYVVPSIPVSNPFIPAPLRTILASRPNPTADFTYNGRFLGFEDRKFISDTNTRQIVVGFKGQLPIQDWTYDIYGSHDDVDLVETQDKALLLSKMRQLLYASDGGASICAGGFNPFGLANSTNVSKACRNFVETRTHDYTQTRQDIVEGNVTGRMFALPAGDVRFSLVGAYRENEFSFDPDNARESNDIIGTLTTAPSSGSTSVKEAAIEVLVPLLKDLPFAKSLDVTLGGRISDYDVVGSFNTYKIDGAWKPIDSLLLRGGFERAIRAPNIGELYSSALSSQAQIGTPPGAGDPCDSRSTARTGASAAQVRALCVATGVPAAIVDTYQYTTVAIGTVASGSTDLTPESADTITVGAAWRSTFQNPWTSGLSASIDYYDIKIDNVISQVSGVTTLNKCYNLDGSNPTYSATNLYCSLVSRDATGGVSTVATPYLNLGGLKTSGIDVQADWRLVFEDAGIGIPGAFTAHVVVNFTDSYQVKLLPGSAWVEYVGTIDGTQAATTPPVGLPLPKSKVFASFGYQVGPVGLDLRWRHLPSMKDVTSVTRPATPAAGVPSYDIFDLNGAWKVNSTLNLQAGITNLFDKDPVQIAGTPGLTQPGTYDIIGRSFYLALTARF